MDLNPSRRMRVLVIGAGRTGAHAIEQLRKNRDIHVVTADPRPELFAVDEGILDHVDITEALTPLTLDKVFRDAQPDLVLIAMPSEDMGLGGAAGLDVLAESMQTEIAALARVPVLVLKRVPT